MCAAQRSTAQQAPARGLARRNRTRLPTANRLIPPAAACPRWPPRNVDYPPSPSPPTPTPPGEFLAYRVTGDVIAPGSPEDAAANFTSTVRKLASAQEHFDMEVVSCYPKGAAGGTSHP